MVQGGLQHREERPRPYLQPKSLGECREHLVWIVDSRKIHEIHAVGKQRLYGLGSRQRQPGFAHPTGPG